MTIALAPVVLIGRNANIAFTTTSEETVDQQVYQEQVDFSHDPPTYRYRNGADVAMQAVPHTIKVPGKPDETFVELPHRARPRHQDRPGAQPRLRDEVRVVRKEWKSFEGFAAAVDGARTSPSTRPRCREIATLHNFFYADRKGNIAYFGAGPRPPPEGVSRPHEAAAVRPATAPHRRRHPGMARNRAVRQDAPLRQPEAGVHRELEHQTEHAALLPAERWRRVLGNDLPLRVDRAPDPVRGQALTGRR